MDRMDRMDRTRRFQLRKWAQQISSSDHFNAAAAAAATAKFSTLFLW